MKKAEMIKREEGFTLIEIIAVLVIMGILAAVAIPKFFDLQQKAREKAIYTAMSELKVRVNQHFAKDLLEGATIGAIKFEPSDVGTNIGEDFNVKGWTTDYNAREITVEIEYIPDLSNPGQNVVDTTKTIAMPQTG